MTKPKRHGTAVTVQTPGPGLLQFRPYVPPVIQPARPGALDFKRHPSVAAGVARPYWGEKP